MTRIAVLGLPFYGRRVAAFLTAEGFQARFVAHPGRRFRAWPGATATLARADLVYGIGSSIRRGGPLDLLLRARKRVIMHWVGTDVLSAIETAERGQVSQRVVAHATHFAETSWLIDELRPLGIAPEQLTLPMAMQLGEVAPLPATFGAMIYLPYQEHPAYRPDETWAVVGQLPDIEFTVVGRTAPPPGLVNATYLGYRDDLRDVYVDTSVLLRLVRHDGMSHSVLEALSHGRYALWPYTYPGVTTIADVPSAVAELRRLQTAQLDGGLGPNTSGAAAVLRDFSPEQIRATVVAAIRRIAG